MTDLNSNPSGDASARGSDITSEHPVVALGGGPAGLTAGYLLAKQGASVTVLEASDHAGGPPASAPGPPSLLPASAPMKSMPMARPFSRA